jgi:thioredoxin 1
MIDLSKDDELDQIKRRKIKEMLQHAIESKPFEKESTKPMILSDANFSTEVGKQRFIVVDFWAPWCGPCRMVGPIIEQLSTEYAGKVTFGKLNVDENPMVPNSYGVQGIPTLMFFKNGRAVDVVVGALPKHHIEAKLRSHMD